MPAIAVSHNLPVAAVFQPQYDLLNKKAAQQVM